VNYFGFNSQLNSKSVKPSPEKHRGLFSPKIISTSKNAKEIKIDLAKISTESALLFYRKTLGQMNKNGYIEVKTLNAGPVSYSSSHAPRHPGFLEKLRGNPTWEPDTFEDFNYWLPKHKYYVGFGTWIGVTLFYATQFVDKAIGFEGDPVAFAMVQTNLNLNKHRAWYNHTHVYPVAVLQGSSQKSAGDVITMRSSSAGGSCSFVGDAKTKQWCGNVGTSWEIKGYTLPHLLNLTDIPVSNETFIKIDVESYEWDLIPSWVDWLKQFHTKPTMRISFHNNRRCGPQELFDKLLTFSKLYKTVWMDGKKTTLLNSFNLSNCFIRTLDFSDHEY
jgi:hypothetical protein